jgi:hypothetical protein
MTLVARRWRGQNPLLGRPGLAISTAITVCLMMAEVEPLVVDQL